MPFRGFVMPKNYLLKNHMVFELSVFLGANVCFEMANVAREAAKSAGSKAWDNVKAGGSVGGLKDWLQACSMFF